MRQARVNSRNTRLNRITIAAREREKALVTRGSVRVLSMSVAGGGKMSGMPRECLQDVTRDAEG